MIRKPSNWENVQPFPERQKLPLGAYVCKVMNAVVARTNYGEMLQLSFDIAEGEYKDYFRKDYKGSMSTNKKWRGVLRVFLPADDNTEKDEITKRTLAGMVTAFENSNPGYKWDWNEKSLVGKTVGILFRNEEWEYNGQKGWAVRPFRALSADTVREGNFTLPKDKPLQGSVTPAASYTNAPAAPAQNNGFTQVEDDDLPF